MKIQAYLTAAAINLKRLATLFLPFCGPSGRLEPSRSLRRAPIMPTHSELTSGRPLPDVAHASHRNRVLQQPLGRQATRPQAAPHHSGLRPPCRCAPCRSGGEGRKHHCRGDGVRSPVALASVIHSVQARGPWGGVRKHHKALSSSAQIDAAIRILFTGEDVLAAHTVVAASHRIVLDLAEKRNLTLILSPLKRP